MEEKAYYRVGGSKEIAADIRVIAATNRNLESLVKDGKFREDLYYRLNVITVEVPPLRERKEDIIELAHHFMYEFSAKYNKPIDEFPHTIMHDLMQYGWPGNIRELRNVMERLVVFAHNGQIRSEDLPFGNNTKQVDTYADYGGTSSSLQTELE